MRTMMMMMMMNKMAIAGFLSSSASALCDGRGRQVACAAFVAKGSKACELQANKNKLKQSQQQQQQQ